jgi:RimJ/RimL family protein N-acetyltransferase
VVWLGVWERNPRAIAFYKKFGFLEVGVHVFPLGFDPQRDIVMSRPTTDLLPDDR